MFKEMFKKLILYGFKIQAAQAAGSVLVSYYNKKEIQEILNEYWKNYLQLEIEIVTQPTLGGTLMVHLAAMSTAFYQELVLRGQTEEKATQIFHNIAWKVYVKMGKLSWWLAGRGNRYQHLLKATKLFRKFPFNSPSYVWQNVETTNNVVSFNCLKCPVAEYFQAKGLSEFCVKTWCALDYPLADMWDAKLERTGSIAGGAAKCYFRWIINVEKQSYNSRLVTVPVIIADKL
jgi:ubiquinone biosynthesis protein